MRFRKIVLMLAIALLGSALVSAPAFAGGGHGRARVSVGVVVGPGWWGPRPFWGPYWGPYWGGYWGGYPYPYYSAPPVVVQPAPQVYIERDSPPTTAAPQQQNWWYFCPGSNAYYPYVRECPGGWQRVSPQPPPS